MDERMDGQMDRHGWTNTELLPVLMNHHESYIRSLTFSSFSGNISYKVANCRLVLMVGGASCSFDSDFRVLAVHR